VTGDVGRGRRASDALAAEQGGQLIKHGVILEQYGEEIDKLRHFKHEMNNHVQELIGGMARVREDLQIVLKLNDRVVAVEEEQAVHSAKCDERYEKIAEYMADSKGDRKEIKDQQAATDRKINDGSNRVLLGLLLAALSIIGLFLWRFGLPPMGN
jgi:hypothetical protein